VSRTAASPTRRRRRLAAGLAAAAALVAAWPAPAADLPRRDVERWGLLAGAADGLLVPTGRLGEEGSLRGFLAVELEDRPFLVDAAGAIRGGGLGGGGTALRATGRFIVQAGFSVAVTPRFELSVRLPVGLMTGSDPNGWTALPASPRGVDLPVALRLRALLASQGEVIPLSAALSVEALPVALELLATGRGSGTATAERGVTPRLELGRTQAGWRTGGLVGATFRRPIDYGTDRLGSEVDLGLMAATDRGPLTLEGSLLASFGFTGLDPAVELIGSARWRFGRGELLALAGPGLGGAPGVPRFRALLGVAWCGEPSAGPLRPPDTPRRAPRAPPDPPFVPTNPAVPPEPAAPTP
jgi:hypothetical protein